MSTDTSEQRERPPYWIALMALVVGFAVSQVVGVIVILASGSSASHPTPLANNVNNFVFDGSFVLAALYFTSVTGWKRRFDFGYRRIAWRTGIGAVFGAAVVYFLVTLAYAAIINTHATDQLPSGFGAHRYTWAAIALAVYVCAVAPMAEEFFFRGFLFGLLRRMHVRVGERELGPWVAAVIVGLLFGLAHYDSAQPEFLIPLGFFGFILCIVRWRTGSLYPGMVLHSLNNAIAFGVNEHLGWSVAEVAALIVGSLALIALVTGPLSAARAGALSET
jgi:hypothetical protein